MRQQPLISIIIPNLDQGQFIGEAIASVVDQSYTNFEIIISDGGSTDNSLEVVKRFETKVKKLISGKDDGQSDAINKGLTFCTGEVITWLNSDDRYLPGTLEKVAQKFAADPSLALFHGRAQLFGENTKSRIVGPAKPMEPHHYLSFMRFPQPASFFAAACWHNAGGLNQDLHYAMDFELVARTVLSGGKIVSTQDVLAEYRLHQSSKSNDEVQFVIEWATVLHRVFETYGESGYNAVLEKFFPIKDAETLRYKISISSSQLHQVLLEFLEVAYHTYYRNSKKRECDEIATYLIGNETAFASKGKFLSYQRRLHLVPAFMFKIVRRFR